MLELTTLRICREQKQTTESWIEFEETRDNRTLNPCVFVFSKRDSISSSYESDKNEDG